MRPDLQSVDGLAAFAPSTPRFSDSNAFLHATKRMWRDRVGNHWVVFAPDRRGLPIVADDRAVAVLDAFNGGASVGDALQRISATRLSGLSPAMCHDLVHFFVERGFLRTTPDARRYLATDHHHGFRVQHALDQLGNRPNERQRVSGPKGTPSGPEVTCMLPCPR